jgi:hypothetical protein
LRKKKKEYGKPKIIAKNAFKKSVFRNSFYNNGR